MDAFTVDVTVVSCQDLPKMDIFGKCDGIVRISANSMEFETNVVRRDYNPKFDYHCPNPFILSCSDRIAFTVGDHDLIGDNPKFNPISNAARPNFPLATHTFEVVGCWVGSVENILLLGLQAELPVLENESEFTLTLPLVRLPGEKEWKKQPFITVHFRISWPPKMLEHTKEQREQWLRSKSVKHVQ